jgi:hypothetical protein
MHAMSAQPGGMLIAERRVAALLRALRFARPSHVAPLSKKDQAKTGEITGAITGEKLCFAALNA